MALRQRSWGKTSCLQPCFQVLACMTGRRRTRVVATGRHKIPHHDRKPDMWHLTYPRHESGTPVFESHITAEVVAGHEVPPVLRSRHTDRSDPEFVRKTIRKCSRMRPGATGYRSAKPVQTRTNSTNPAVRMSAVRAVTCACQHMDWPEAQDCRAGVRHHACRDAKPDDQLLRRTGLFAVAAA